MICHLSLEIKQQCFVPINIHFYEDKFWSYIATKGVGQTKDVDIYDRSISKFFENAIMENITPYKLSTLFLLLLNLMVYLSTFTCLHDYLHYQNR